MVLSDMNTLEQVEDNVRAMAGSRFGVNWYF